MAAKLPSTMKAIKVQSAGKAAIVSDAPVPQMRDDQILVKVHAVGLVRLAVPASSHYTLTQAIYLRGLHYDNTDTLLHRTPQTGNTSTSSPSPPQQSGATTPGPSSPAAPPSPNPTLNASHPAPASPASSTASPACPRRTARSGSTASPRAMSPCRYLTTFPSRTPLRWASR